MADLFDDNNLFGDSFDLLQSNNLFADTKKTQNNLNTQKTNTQNNQADFGFDDNLFGDSNNLFGADQNLFDVGSGQELNNDIFNQSDNIFSDKLDNLNFDNLQQTSKDNLAQKNVKKTKNKKEKIAKPLKNKQVDKKNKKQKDLASDNNLNQNKKTKNIFKNKKFVIIASAVLTVIIAVVVGVVILNNNQGTKFDTPSFMIYQHNSGTVLVIDSAENASGYEVVITQNGQNQTSFTSATSAIELRLYLNEPGNFDVKVRVLGKSAGLNSDYSITKSFTNYVKLQTPEVFRNGDMLSWNAVYGASEYKVYYRANAQTDTVEYVTISAQDTMQFDLTTLNEFGAGLYPVCVEAVASNEYYLNSDCSESFAYEYVTSLDAPLIAIFDQQTLSLSFAVLANKTKADRYLLTVSLNNGTTLGTHYIYADDLAFETITYLGTEAVLYEASLAELLSGELVSLTLKAVGDGVYSTDSLAIDVTTI